jgi:hypothetical protein
MTDDKRRCIEGEPLEKGLTLSRLRRLCFKADTFFVAWRMLMQVINTLTEVLLRAARRKRRSFHNTPASEGKLDNYFSGSK